LNCAWGTAYTAQSSILYSVAKSIVTFAAFCLAASSAAVCASARPFQSVPPRAATTAAVKP
jgi:hypothetical protein